MGAGASIAESSSGSGPSSCEAEVAKLRILAASKKQREDESDDARLWALFGDTETSLSEADFVQMTARLKLPCLTTDGSKRVGGAMDASAARALFKELSGEGETVLVETLLNALGVASEPEELEVEQGTVILTKKNGIHPGQFGPIFREKLVCSKTGDEHTVAVKLVYKIFEEKKKKWSSLQGRSVRDGMPQILDGVTAQSVDDPQREIDVLQRLSSSSEAGSGCKFIPRLYGVVESPKAYFVVMEYAGMDLRDQISVAALKTAGSASQRLSFSQRERKAIFKQVAQAVSFLHANGVCHLDLSTENIVACYDNEKDIHVKIIDFGCAKFLKLSNGMRSPKTQIVDYPTGKPMCMAPEFFLGSGQGKRSFSGTAADIWACGIILVELLAPDVVLWKRAEESDWRYKTLESCMRYDRIDPLVSIEPGLGKLSPKSLGLVLKLLQTHPGRRITADQLVSHLCPAWLDASECNEYNADKGSLIDCTELLYTSQQIIESFDEEAAKHLRVENFSKYDARSLYLHLAKGAFVESMTRAAYHDKTSEEFLADMLMNTVVRRDTETLVDLLPINYCLRADDETIIHQGDPDALGDFDGKSLAYEREVARLEQSRTSGKTVLQHKNYFAAFEATSRLLFANCAVPLELRTTFDTLLDGILRSDECKVAEELKNLDAALVVPQIPATNDTKAMYEMVTSDEFSKSVVDREVEVAAGKIAELVSTAVGGYMTEIASIGSYLDMLKQTTLNFSWSDSSAENKKTAVRFFKESGWLVATHLERYMSKRSIKIFGLIARGHETTLRVRVQLYYAKAVNDAAIAECQETASLGSAALLQRIGKMFQA